MHDGAALSLSQFSNAWRLLCGGAPGFTTDRRGDTTFVFSGLPLAFFNIAVLEQPRVSSVALRTLGKEACGWAGDKGVPWLLVVTHETLATGVDAAAALADCGLVPMLPLTGMLAQRILPNRAAPTGLDLAVPDDDRACAAIVDVNAAAYGVNLDASKVLFGTRAFWTKHVGVLGRVGGVPASSAAVLTVDGLHYVALVATDPSFQRRGFAEATMRKALEVAAQRFGQRPTFLHATDAGRPVYERMGYTPIATHTLFIEKRFLDSH